MVDFLEDNGMPKRKLRHQKSRKSNLVWGLALLSAIYFGSILTSSILRSLTSKSGIESKLSESELIYGKLDAVNSGKRLRRQILEDNFDIASPKPRATDFFNSASENITESESQGIYPVDLFDKKSRRQGAVVLHVLGMLYMFVALAIVCDEFFVPALEVIIHRLSISEDVAGATFMAAGGSAPELFTSIIGVFLAKSNVGVGTIVGSAVFNILFVIGMCSLVSHELLHLTWWPLFRDCSFYIVSLLVLIISFYDSLIEFDSASRLRPLRFCFCDGTYQAEISYSSMPYTSTLFKLAALQTYIVCFAAIVCFIAIVSSVLWLAVVASTQQIPSTMCVFYESIILILVYVSYVTFMKYNRPIEGWIKSKLTSVLPSSPPQVAKVGPSEKSREVSKSVKAVIDSISNPDQQHHKSTFSYGIVQLMMHSLDPASEDSMTEKSARMYALARMKMISPKTVRSLSARYSNRQHPRYEKRCQSATPTTVIYENEGVKVVSQSPSQRTKPGLKLTPPDYNSAFNGVILTPIHEESENPSSTSRCSVISQCTQESNIDEENTIQTRNGKVTTLSQPPNPSIASNEGSSEPLDLSWPETNAKRCIYLLLFPITFLLWITLPDVRNPQKEKWFMASFFGSITWIAGFSYLMVWMAHQIGETAHLSEAVMGLTFLAAGTSVPDLITSVIVARKGLGDMAVSSSVGSNIFDITIGLPFPWLLASIIKLGKPIGVKSKGLFCSVLLLFAMLLFVVISIAVCRWKMSKRLGFTMLLLYVVFLVLSILLELSIIKCLFSTT